MRAWNARGEAARRPVIEAGGGSGDRRRRPLARVNALCEKMNDWLERTVARSSPTGKLVATVGGDHASVYGGIPAHAHEYPGMGMLHLDAHADLRDAYEGFTWSHASIMSTTWCAGSRACRGWSRWACATSARRSSADRDPAAAGGASSTPTRELKRRGFDGVPWTRQVDAHRRRPCPSRSTCPSTSTAWTPRCVRTPGRPCPAGCRSPRPPRSSPAWCAPGARIVGMDLNEVAPGPEGDEWDGNVGARLLYKMIGWALRSQRGGEGR